jgi:peptidyl-prolyl cis-trans isomerase SurA
MTLRGSGFWSVAILLSAATPVLAQTPPPQTGNPPRMVLDRVVASVNDEALTLSEVQEEGQPVIRKIFQDFVGAERERRVEQAEQHLVNDLIDRRLLYQVAKKEGMLPSTAEVQGALEEIKRNNNAADDVQFRALLKAEGLTLDQVRRTISERLAIGRLLARQVRSSIILGEEELAKYYEANPEKFRRVPEAQIHHALFSVGSGEGEAKVKARVEEAGAKIRAGADFGATAGQYGADAVASGADVLTVHRGELAPEIEAVAFSLPVGEISAPIRTDVGYHLIRVEKVRAEPVAPFAEVRELIRDQLLQEKFEARRKDYIAGLRARASIQVFLKEGEILGIPGGARESEAVTRRSP